MDAAELASLISDLRAEGSESTELEVKLAANGFPENLMATLSAFANRPGGGTIVFGLDERGGFRAVGVYDVDQCQATLATKARTALTPPVVVESHSLTFEGSDVVVAKVLEIPSHAKPCRVKRTGKAYLRFHDGDYMLSDLEEQAFVANRTTPVFDQQPVPGTTRADLLPDLVTSYLETCRASSTALSRMTDDEILFRTGVTVAPTGGLSLAGLLALGLYPQQHLPNLVIQASVAPGVEDPPGMRARGARRFDGPLPLMLDEALQWVQRNTNSRVRMDADGHVRDSPEFPANAVRELLSNALIHRDLGPHSLNQAVTLKLERNQLVLSNPGGLWGITVNRLGKTGVSSARNGYLLRICQNVRSQEGNRVVEALASGIPAVLRSLHEAGMVAPRFHDQGMSFTVTVPNHALLATEDLEWLAALPGAKELTDRQSHALAAMRHGQAWTNKTFRDAFPMDSTRARAELAGLVDAGLAVAEGDRGARVYRLASRLTEASSVPDLVWVGELPRHRNQARILAELETAPRTAAELAELSSLSPRQVQYALQRLREDELIVLVGAIGRRGSYYEVKR